MDNKECEVCTKMVKEKYKHYKTWRNLAIVFMCFTVLFAILYFASGEIATSRTVEYDNSVVIKNDGDYNTNTDNGNIVIEKENDSTGGIIILAVIILVGGILGGCYIVSQRTHNNSQHSNNKE